ncbi:unnamed protein product [Cochlearia groenlandica]
MSNPDDLFPGDMSIDASTAVTVATTTTRRVPPPCWTNEESAALVDAYKDKWFALRRGNLRASDWDEVAAAVSSSSTIRNPPKSAIQCRHKIEKLRKRYRGEKQRSLTRPGKFSSSWDLFPILDAIRFAPVAQAPVKSYDHDDESNGLDESRARSKRSGRFSGYNDSPIGDGSGVRSKARSHVKLYGGFDSDHDSGGGFGLKRRYNGGFEPDSDDEIVLVPKAARVKAHGKPSSVGGFSHGGGGVFPVKSFGNRNLGSHVFKPKNFGKHLDYDDEFDDGRAGMEGFNTRIQNSRSSSRVNGYIRKDGSYPQNTNGVSNGYGSSSRFKHKQMNASSAAGIAESDPIDEVVASVKMMTEMFARVENSKMEMMREMEKTRMEMELKQCQMMLESQQQIIGAFTEAMSERKNTNTRRSFS